MSDFWDREVVERHHIEWMALLPVRLHINELIGEGERQWPIEWFESWLRGRKFRRALSIGCGTGALERQLIERGLCHEVDAFDGSLTSLHIARDAAVRAGLAGRIRYFAADFNRCVLPVRTYDIAFFHQSAHHIARLERFFMQLLGSLEPNGLVYLDEYVGPSRFEWSDDRIAPQQSFFDALPVRLRLHDRLPLPIQQDDPSEAVRSSEIEPELSVGFDIAARRPYGGTLLSVVLPNVRFDALGDSLPFFIGCERALLAAGMPSFYAIVVARPKRNIRKAIAQTRYAARRLRNRIRSEWIRFRARPSPSSYPPTLPS
jgi:SAM-dependent methyltransferase